MPEPRISDVCMSLHTAFRKAADSKEANTAWHAIKEMDNHEWKEIVKAGLEWVGIEVSDE